MADSEKITENLLEMYGRGDWISRFNFRVFLERSGLAKLPRDTRILDLGCAMGHLLVLLREAGFTDLTGLDAAPGMVEAARRLTGLPVVEADAADCAAHFPAGGFGAVVVSDLLHHIDSTAGWDRLLAGCRQLLSPGGWLLIREPWPTLPVRLLQWMSRYRVFYVGPLKTRLQSFVDEAALVEHFFRHWMPDYPQRLARAGFRLERDFDWLVHRITVARREA